MKQDQSAASEIEPKLYSDLAAWWPLLSAPSDYAEEAAFFHQVLINYSQNQPRTVLELGSGGGNNASHLKAHYDMMLVDRSAGMIAVSRSLNPECEHVQGDMRTVRLGRRFDAVFVHDAIMYMTSENDLQKAIESAYVHCCDGGIALFVPDFTRESFHPSTQHGGHDGETLGMRYLEWTYDPDPADSTYVTHFAYLLREQDGSVRAEQDLHVCGLFNRDVWMRLMKGTGFSVRVVLDPFGRELFVGTRKDDSVSG